jgi:hypothetical protein
LLVFRRRKFRNPVILSSGNGRPAEILGISRKQIFKATNIDAISAKDRTTKLKPKKFQMYAQNNPANPPSTNPCVFALKGVSNLPGIRGFSLESTYIKRYSHTAVKTVAKLSADRGR